MRWLGVLLVAACGGGSSPTVIASGPPAAMIAQPAADDPIVAQVAGRPVYGSCVAGQIAATPTKSRRVALDECIAFELMAQEAERRDLSRHRDTIEATRTALVARLIDQFAAQTSPDALAQKIDELYKPELFTRGEHRESYQAIVTLPAKPTEAEIAAAKELAQTIYAALEHETGLLPPHLEETATRIGGSKVELQGYRPTAVDDRRTLPEYRGVLFGISEVGRVAPPLQTRHGFHIVLLTNIIPASKLDRAAAGPIIHGNLQRRMFDELYKQIAARSTVQTFPEVLDALEKGAP